MKETTISITVDAEKLKAIECFAPKKEVDLNAELLNTFNNVYKKCVPAAVKEFIKEE